jgi:hypothetical protein
MLAKSYGNFYAKNQDFGGKVMQKQKKIDYACL